MRGKKTRFIQIAIHNVSAVFLRCWCYFIFSSFFCCCCCSSSLCLMLCAQFILFYSVCVTGVRIHIFVYSFFLCSLRFVLCFVMSKIQSLFVSFSLCVICTSRIILLDHSMANGMQTPKKCDGFVSVVYELRKNNIFIHNNKEKNYQSKEHKDN